MPHEHLLRYAESCFLGLDRRNPAFAGIRWDDGVHAQLATVAARLRSVLAPPPLRPVDPHEPVPQQNRTSLPDETCGELAERCLAGRWVSVGRAFEFPDGPRYDVSPDPALNTQGLPFGEWTWQLNRHWEWALLTRLSAATGDARYARGVCGWIEQWLVQAPPPGFDPGNRTGTWRTIEIGIRLGQSWPHVLHLAKDMDDLLLVAWLGAWAEQAAFVWQHRRTGNWLLMEMAGLASAGVCLPWHRDAARWRRDACDALVGSVPEQFHPDMMQYELSTSYHVVCIHNYRIAVDTLRRGGYDVPATLTDAIARMYAPFRALARPDGWCWSFQDSTPVHAGRMLRGLEVERRAPHDGFFIDGSETPPPQRHSLLPYAGYAVLRSGWHRDALCLAFDGGPFGFAHMHQDKLALQLMAHGCDLIGDAGLVDYSDTPQRRYSQTTQAHSAALVDGEGQNRWHAFDRFAIPLDRPAGMVHDLDAPTPWVRACFDEGYGMRKQIPVRQTRTVLLLADDLVAVHDRFDAEDDAEHRVELLWHLLVDETEADGLRIASRGDGAKVALAAVRHDAGAIAADVTRGGTTPDLRGWAQCDDWKENKGAWELVPRPCWTVSASFTGSVEITTVIAVGAPGAPLAAPAFSVCDGSIVLGGRTWSLPPIERAIAATE